MEFSELDVRATTERPLFTRYQPKTLHLVLDNPVIEFASLGQSLEARYRALGYDLLIVKGNTPAEREASQRRALETADLVVVIRIGDSSMEKFSARAAQGRHEPTIAVAGAGGAVAGFLSSPSDPISSVVGAAVGLTLGAVVDVTINSWVHLGVLDVNADVFARERLPAAQAKAAAAKGEDVFRESITRVNVRARQAQLKWENAAPAIEAALSQELGRLIPPR
jgi:hypothetical protein